MPNQRNFTQIKAAPPIREGLPPDAYVQPTLAENIEQVPTPTCPAQSTDSEIRTKDKQEEVAEQEEKQKARLKEEYRRLELQLEEMKAENKILIDEASDLRKRNKRILRIAQEAEQVRRQIEQYLGLSILCIIAIGLNLASGI